MRPKSLKTLTVENIYGKYCKLMKKTAMASTGAKSSTQNL
jgi:hypothetical protein